MNWQKHIEDLKTGKTVSFRPRGNSMKPKIESGELVTVSPETNDLKQGDIVFCKVKGNNYIHLISAIDGERYQISNNHNFINGWISKNSIFGKVIKVEK